MTLELKKRFVTSIFLIIFFYCIFIDKNFLAISLILVSLISFYEFIKMNFKIFKNKRALRYILNTIFILYIFILSLILYTFILSPSTVMVIILTFLICIASDIGGYVSGKIFKGKKLTKISPNKTISGSLGSFVFSILIIYLFSFFKLLSIDFRLIIFALITSLFCQLGDILFSFLKRKAKIKDTGNILPGHGGVLDRIDGILFGIPVGILTLYLLSV
tara:strand:+ start:2245 stop:2898 length:654 start_codon:yes stop_codon:yes gene_type:complete